MVATVKIPPHITAAIDHLERQHRELESKRDNLDRRISQLLQQLRLAMAENGNDSKRKITELTEQLTSARSAFDDTERDMAKVRLAHSQYVQAADQARLPVRVLDVKCPGCRALVSPLRTGTVVNGCRTGTFDCAACDTTFDARWSGGTDPVVTVRET
jgi:hypothetical protein